MSVWGDRDASCRPLYSGTGRLRLSWLSRWVVVAATFALGLASAGCSYQLDSLLSKDKPDPEPTGSTVRVTEQVSASSSSASSASSLPSEYDLAYARAVAADVLAHGSKGTSVPWANPNTGASGNITPLAVPYSEGGLPCRDFLASYVHGGTQDWLQGAGCRTSQGRWEVTRLKPLSRS